MTSYRYTGDTALVFPYSTFTVSSDREPRTVEPGDDVEADENPDPRWFVGEGGPELVPLPDPAAITVVIPDPAAPAADPQEG